MRISDWSSDVCSSDLQCPEAGDGEQYAQHAPGELGQGLWDDAHGALSAGGGASSASGAGVVAAAVAAVALLPSADRKSVGSGKSVSVRVDLGGRRILKKNKTRDP